MTLSNRTLNRALLLLIGVIALAAGLVLALRQLPAVAEWSGISLEQWVPAAPDMTDAPVLWTLAAVLLVCIALAIGWITTRGRGRTRFAVEADDILIDDTALAGILRAELESTADVLAVSAQGYRRYGGTVLVNIETRSRADLRELLAGIRRAVSSADTTIGTAVPLVIHLTTGIRTAASGSRTTK